jgi:hypothetical protein
MTKRTGPKNDLQNITQKPKDRATQTQLITEVGLCYSLV